MSQCPVHPPLAFYEAGINMWHPLAKDVGAAPEFPCYVRVLVYRMKNNKTKNMRTKLDLSGIDIVIVVVDANLQ